jgi:hypothetical protein
MAPWTRPPISKAEAAIGVITNVAAASKIAAGNPKV